MEFRRVLFFFQAEDGIRDWSVTGVQTCALLFSSRRRHTRLVSDWSSDVCSSDLAKLRSEFDKRNVKVVALSADPLDSHMKWIGDIEETQNTHMNYPIIADPKFEVANLYDMIHPQVSDKFTVRSVFVIGPDKKVKLTITYPAATGRNFDEILRVIDSLQLTANYSVATPANWKHGEDVIITAAVKDEDVPAKFPKGVNRVKPYLRITPQPNL